MRKFGTAALAGVACAVIGGVAIAATANNHVMNVALPDGSVARIAYQGDVPPKLTVVPAAPSRVVIFDPLDASPFGMFDQVMAQMDRQAATMMQQVAALQSTPVAANGAVDLAAFGKLPAGTTSYSYVSTSDGSGSCSRTVEISSTGAKSPPRVVSHTSGDCAGSTPSVAPSTVAVPGLTTASAKAAAPAQPAKTAI
ncbi:hypothetical protein [Glacieibacterium sp.]|uniref:hypothetical protein n=1 Tax=Glacieibacterium sp. TaxID=2860237 RepID=UPI003AFFC817